MKNITTNIFSEIRTKYNTLSDAQKVVADYVLNNTSDIIMISISDLSVKCNTSDTTVMRFIRKLGYNSFQVFRVKMAQDFSGESAQSIYNEIDTDDSVSEIRQKVIASTISSLNDANALINDEDLIKSAQALQKSRKILFYGAGASSNIAADAFHKFSRLGLNVVTYNDPHIMSILCSHMRENDTIMLFSHSGESREVLDVARVAKENKATIIAITSYLNSSLHKLADITLLSSTNETKYRSDSMVSRIIQLTIIDILYVTIVLSMGSKSLENVNKSRIAVAKNKT